MYDKLREHVKLNEGFRGMPYKDHLGNWTIGFGTLLPITNAEAELLMDHRLNRALTEASRYPWFGALNQARQAVVVEMIYQLGPGGFTTFKKLIAALGRHDYREAKRQMLDSLWARDQTPRRARELASIMESGKDRKS